MNVLKKLLMALGVLALIFMVITVTINILNEKEKEEVLLTVNSAFDALKNYDMETLGNYMNTDAITKEATDVVKTNGSKDEVTESEKALFKHITYTVTEPEEVTIFDKEIQMEVKLSNKNMGEVLVKYFKDALVYSFSTAFSTDTVTQEESDKKMQELFVEAIDSENISITESVVDIKLIKQENGTWKIEFVNEEQFVNAILPSFQETLTNYLTENNIID